MSEFSSCVSTFLVPLVYPFPLLLPKRMCSKESVLGLLPSFTWILFTLSLLFKRLFLFFLALLGLCRFADFSLVAISLVVSLVVVHELLIAVASLLVKHRLSGPHGLSSCRSQALEPKHSRCAARV